MKRMGEKIYRLRKQKGLSQEELGFELGVSRQTVSKWEANTMKPTMDNMTALCGIFNVDFNYFISEGSEDFSKDDGMKKSHDDANDCIGMEASNQTEVELALGNTISDTDEPVKSAKPRKGFIVGLLINSFILMISIFCTVCIGFATSSHDMAPVVVTSSGLDIWHFYLSIVFSAVIILLETFFIVKIIKKPKM